jgi:general secretion pathway protein G
METASEAEKKRGRWWRLVLLAILACASLVYVCLWKSASRSAFSPDIDGAVRSHIEQYKTMLLMYQGANGFHPTTEQGLKALITRPEIEPKPRNWRQLLDKPILDPWKQEYFYEQPGRHNPNGYDMYSAGKDRKPGTAHDIGNWPQK